MEPYSNPIVEKSLNFAMRIIKLNQHISEQFREFTIAKQVLIHGTGIGEHVSDALYGDNKNDFEYNMRLALKSASKTEYWLKLLQRTGYLEDKGFVSIMEDCTEIKKILTKIVKTSSQGLGFS